MSTVLSSQPVAGASASVASAEPASPRLESVDLLRGLALVVMALDHVRDYFSNAPYSPTDLDQTTPALFWTRWITHFCAPVFIFLAGTGVFLSARHGKTRPELARFLLTRGVWLIVLELTVLRFGMCFSFDYHWVSFTVLWAIGWSMIVLAALIHLPTRWVAAFGIVMIAGHNLLDGVNVEGPGWVRLLWAALHGPPETFPTRVGMRAHFMYPLIPWVGVMAVGYAFGELMTLDRPKRRKVFLTLGTALTIAFMALRAANFYGDPERWTAQRTPLFTLLSFLNCEKYPPSLLFLLMTLGPAIALLAVLDREGEPGKTGTWLIMLGRVPLFFFLLHWMVAHALAVGLGLATGQPVLWMFQVPPFQSPDGYGYSLPVVYLVWMSVVVLVAPVCRWYAEYKRRRRDLWWLSYI